MIGKKVYFKTEIVVPEYVENGQYKNTKIVEKAGVILDKYRGSVHKIDSVRDIFNHVIVDFYLINAGDTNLYHVLPKDIINVI